MLKGILVLIIIIVVSFFILRPIIYPILSSSSIHNIQGTYSNDSIQALNNDPSAYLGKQVTLKGIFVAQGFPNKEVIYCHYNSSIEDSEGFAFHVCVPAANNYVPLKSYILTGIVSKVYLCTCTAYTSTSYVLNNSNQTSCSPKSGISPTGSTCEPGTEYYLNVTQITNSS